jgi:nucleoside-triphosphatase
MIYILTGDIRSGKTTALLHWIEGREDVDGLLCPDDKTGKRYFLKVKSKQEFKLEIESGNDIEMDKIVVIGPFQFLKSAFEKANDYLKSISNNSSSKFIIIDELGKLELKNKGLHDAASKLISNKTCNTKHLILVVRSSHLNKIIERYKLSEYTLIRKEELNAIGNKI